MYKMETKTETERILAKLMGFEGQQGNKQPQCRQPRVLSERYLQEIALISRRCEKKSFDRYRFRLFSMDMEDEMLDENDSAEVLRNSYSSDDKIRLESYEKEADKIHQKFKLLNSTQKADRDYPWCCGDYSTRFSKSPNEMGSISCKPLRSVLQNDNLQLCSSSYLNGRKPRTCFKRRERGDFQHFHAEAGLGHGSMVRRGAAKQVANELRQSVWHNYSKGLKSKDCGFAKFSNFPGNMNTRKVQCEPIKNSNSQNIKFNVHKDWCLNLVNSESALISKSEVDLTSRNSESVEDFGSEGYVSCDETPLILSDLNELGGGDLFEDSCGSGPLSPNKISACSDVDSITNNAIERVLDELPDMLQEIGSFRNRECSNFVALRQQVADDFLSPLQESKKHSPPYPLKSNTMCPDSASKSKHNSTAQLHTVQGSDVNLQQSKAEFSNLEAKRPKIKKDTKEAGESIASTTSKTEETEVMSYLDDMLAELGHQPLEDLASLRVFDSLEKKYGKQQSWHQSERKLLFDRIKSGLSEILCPHTGITSKLYKPRTKRYLLQLSQQNIKAELLDLLVYQEKEVRRESSSEKIDKHWLELEEDMQTFIKEIQEDLMNELVEEIVLLIC